MAETSVRLLQCAVADKGLLRIDQIGSGVGVIFYSSVRKIGAGLHVLAPSSGSVRAKNPIMYADTAILHVLELLEKDGVIPPFSVAIAGGACMLGGGEAAAGSKVVEGVRDALAKANLAVKFDETGGTKVRTMILDIDAGKIKIS